MNITETIKKVYEAEAVLTISDIEHVILEHFKQKFNAKGSELSIAYAGEDILVSYRRVEVVK